MEVSVAKAHNRLSHILKQLSKGPVRVTRHGKPVGVIIDPEEYERLQQVQAYVQMIRISEALQASEVKAADLYRASREELEGDA